MSADGAVDDRDDDLVVEASGVVTRFGAQTVHEGLQLRIRRGELVALIGGSGTGKSVLLREIIGLHRPDAGRVRLLGTDVWNAPARELAAVRRRFGMMFQEGALFSSLTVAANVAAPLREHLDLPDDLIDRLVRLRLSLAGLPPEAGAKMPSQLSGGMRKRAALARALVLDPELLLLDEPGSGLDPPNAARLDELVLQQRDASRAGIVLVTHDVATVRAVADRVLFLDAPGVPPQLGTLAALLRDGTPTLRAFFERAPRPETAS